MVLEFISIVPPSFVIDLNLDEDGNYFPFEWGSNLWLLNSSSIIAFVSNEVNYIRFSEVYPGFSAHNDRSLIAFYELTSGNVKMITWKICKWVTFILMKLGLSAAQIAKVTIGIVNAINF